MHKLLLLTVSFFLLPVFIVPIKHILADWLVLFSTVVKLKTAV